MPDKPYTTLNDRIDDALRELVMQQAAGLRPEKVARAKRLKDIPDAALSLIESGARGLDNVLEDLAADPGLPAESMDDVPQALAEEDGERWDGLS